jgi:hypothetical protein
MVGALIADLFILPALLRLTRPFLRMQERSRVKGRPEGTIRIDSA